MQPDFGSSTDAVAAPDLFQSQEYPSRFNCSIVDVLSDSAFFHLKLSSRERLLMAHESSYKPVEGNSV